MRAPTDGTCCGVQREWPCEGCPAAVLSRKYYGVPAKDMVEKFGVPAEHVTEGKTYTVERTESTMNVVNQQGEIACRARCGRTTRMLGTKLCDRCWEIEHRQRDIVELLHQNGFALAHDMQQALDLIFSRR